MPSMGETQEMVFLQFSVDRLLLGLLANQGDLDAST